MQSLLLYECQQAVNEFCNPQLGFPTDQKRSHVFPILNDDGTDFSTPAKRYLVPYLLRIYAKKLFSRPDEVVINKTEQDYADNLLKLIQNSVPKSEQFFCAITLHQQIKIRFMKMILSEIKEDSDKVSLAFYVREVKDLFKDPTLPETENLFKIFNLLEMVSPQESSLTAALSRTIHLHSSFSQHELLKELIDSTLTIYNALDHETTHTWLYLQLTTTSEPQWWPQIFTEGGQPQWIQVVIPTHVKSEFVKLVMTPGDKVGLIPIWSDPCLGVSIKDEMRYIKQHTRPVGLHHGKGPYPVTVHNVSNPSPYTVQIHDGFSHWLRMSFLSRENRHLLILITELISREIGYELNSLTWILLDMDIPIELSWAACNSHIDTAITSMIAKIDDLNDKGTITHPYGAYTYLVWFYLNLQQKLKSGELPCQTLEQLNYKSNGINLMNKGGGHYSWTTEYIKSSVFFNLYEWIDHLNKGRTIKTPFSKISLEASPDDNARWVTFNCFYRALSNLSENSKQSLSDLKNAIIPHLEWSRNCGLHLKLGDKRYYPLDLTDGVVRDVILPGLNPKPTPASSSILFFKPAPDSVDAGLRYASPV